MGDYFDFADGETIEVTAYVRPPLLLEPMDKKLETLRVLAEEAVIDSLTTEQWPGTVPLSTETIHSETLEVFYRFEQWAEVNEVSVCPPFAIQTTTSELRGETYRVLRTPAMCLEIVSDGDLSCVFPHVQGGNEYSVTTALAAIRANSLLTDPRQTDTELERYDCCPRCEGKLVYVQGVVVCHDCVWDNWDTVVDIEYEQSTLMRQRTPAPEL